MALLSIKEIPIVTEDGTKLLSLDHKLLSGQIHVISDLDNSITLSIRQTLKLILAKAAKDGGNIYQGAADKAKLEATYFAQELHSYFPSLTFGENLNLGLGRIISQQKQLTQAASLARDDLGWQLPEFAHYGSPDTALCQKISLLRALSTPASLVIFDNTFSTLASKDINRLCLLLKKQATAGRGIVILTTTPHKFSQIATELTIIRGGRVYKDLPTANAAATEDNTRTYPQFPHKPTGNILEVLGLQLKGFTKEISFTLRKGEILGIAGLTGSGKNTLLQTIYGLRPAASGIITINGKHLKARTHNTELALEKGLSFYGFKNCNFPTLSTAQNIALPTLKRFSTLGFVSDGKLEANLTECLNKLNTQPQSNSATSGGNQDMAIQPLRLLTLDNAVVLCEQPTRNMTYEQRQDFYRLLATLVSEGKGIIITGSSIDELQNICDTIAVIHNGELCPPRPAAKWTTEEIELYENSGKLGAVSIL